MADVLDAIRGAMGNYHYLALYGIALVLLLVLLKDKRKVFVILCIAISAVVMNPAFYRIWNAINGYAYWRTLWIIPIIPVCAAVPAVLVEKREKNWVKGTIAAASAAVFMLAGSYIYHGAFTGFSRAWNAEKLPDSMVKTAEALLELDDTPFVVADNEIYIYLRQYSGKIRSMYARDIYWGTAGDIAQSVYEQLTVPDGDLHQVARIMLDYDYEYLVVRDADEERKLALEEAGFAFVRQVEAYGIYRVTGIPTEVRTYNEKQQVVARTFVDENGEPMNGPDGYASRSFTYDEYGRIVKQIQTDVYGKPVLDAYGKAGYEREYDRHGWLLKEVWIGTDEKPIEAGGYAIRKCTYDSKGKIIEESYYDAEGERTASDKGYAWNRFSYTEDGELSLIHYYDLNDQPIEAGSGFLHEYLQSLKGKDITVFMAAKDDASSQMTVTLFEDMQELGIQTDLRGAFRKSFYAIVTPEAAKEQLSEEAIQAEGFVGDVPYTVSSAGFSVGAACSIQIDGVEYAKNARGLNIVVFDNKEKKVIDTIAFDLVSQDITVTR